MRLGIGFGDGFGDGADHRHATISLPGLCSLSRALVKPLQVVERCRRGLDTAGAHGRAQVVARNVSEGRRQDVLIHRSTPSSAAGRERALRTRGCDRDHGGCDRGAGSQRGDGFGDHREHRQSERTAGGKLPPKVHYFSKIQEAVNASKRNDWVLIEPGVYDEEVKVTRAHSGIYIRGMNRNTVILDGQSKPKPEGSNGIEVYRANNVWIENLTVRNFERASSEGPGGNEIWWNGGEDSEEIGARGWYGRYLTAYDTGMNGGYGIFTNNESRGFWDNIYASGFNDSGIYIGACHECNARVKDATMENNALGYSGSNAGGKPVDRKLAVQAQHRGDRAELRKPRRRTAAAGRGLQATCSPQPAATLQEQRKSNTARSSATTRSRENNNLSAPSNLLIGGCSVGRGREFPGDYGDLVENNIIRDNPTNGVLAFEYPNPFPPQEDTIYFQLAGNKISDNTFSGNGYAGGAYAGDVMMEGGLFGKQIHQQLPVGQ